MTNLQSTIELYTELGWSFQVMETPSRTLLVQELAGGGSVQVTSFSKLGASLKGYRVMLKVTSNSRSRFFMADGSKMFLEGGK